MIEHPFLVLDPKYLYKGYRYKIEFTKAKSRWSFKHNKYEPHIEHLSTTAVFSHQTKNYYMFVRPKVAVLKNNLVSFDCLDYEGGI